MPLSNDEAVKSKPLVYTKVVDGFFVVGDEKEKFKSLEGTFKRTWIKHDPGNAKLKISASDVLVVDIEDDESLYRLQTKLGITFTWSFAAYLVNLEKDMQVKIRVEPGTDPKVSFPFVSYFEEDNWINVTKEKFPSDASERTERVREIVANHSALYVPKPKED